MFSFFALKKIIIIHVFLKKKAVFSTFTEHYPKNDYIKITEIKPLVYYY